MSKRTYEGGSSKRKKATAKADALWAVIEKTKPITHFFSEPEGPNRGGYRSGVPGSTPAGSCVFLSDRSPESKICEKSDLDPESLFIFSSRSLCGFHTWHFLSKKHCWISVASMAAGVWTEPGPKFWKRRGFGVWNSDNGHLCLPEGLPI